MSFLSVMKYNARLALRGNWPRAILVSLISGVLAILLGLLQNQVLNTFVPASPLAQAEVAADSGLSALYQYALYLSGLELGIMCLFSLVSIFLLAPISLGVTGWFWSLVQGQALPFSAVFRYFESFRRYRRAIWYELTMLLRSLGWAILFLAPSLGVLWASLLSMDLYAHNDERVYSIIAFGGMLLVLVLVLLGLFLFSAFMNRYLLSAYLVYLDDEMSVGTAIKTSIAQTKGYRFPLLWFQLSFLGWWLLGIFVPILLVLHTIPYMNTATAMYARYLMEKRQVADNATQEFVVGDHTPEI